MFDTNHSLLAAIPRNLLPKTIDSVYVIKGDFNNRNILINKTLLIKEYLLRDEISDQAKDRYYREKMALETLKENPHVPKLIKTYSRGLKFFLARKWIEGNPIQHKILPEKLDSLISALSTIHKYKKDVNNESFINQALSRYLKEYKEISTQLSSISTQKEELLVFPKYTILKRLIEQYQHEIENITLKGPLVRVHGDLTFSNILISEKNENIVLIDWEYSTWGISIFDLAYLCSQNQISIKFQEKIITRYEKKTGIKIDSREFSVLYNLSNLLSALWYTIRAVRYLSKNLDEKDENSLFKLLINSAISKFHYLDLI